MASSAADVGGQPDHAGPDATSVSQATRKSIITVTEPLSPPRCEGGPRGRLREWASHLRGSPDRSVKASDGQPAQEIPRTVMDLPDELQIMILSFLDFTDIERLRHTSKYWHAFATPRLMRRIWGHYTYNHTLIRHCRVCLADCPDPKTRTAATRADAGFPLSSRCLSCTVQSRDGTVRIGRRVKLGNLHEYWTCRWCGWPVTDGSSARRVQFHRKCYHEYHMVKLAFFCLGCIQFAVGLAAAVLACHYLPRDKVVLLTSVSAFVLACLCVLLVVFRGKSFRTYKYTLAIELAVLGLWVRHEFLAAH